MRTNIQLLLTTDLAIQNLKHAAIEVYCLKK